MQYRLNVNVLVFNQISQFKGKLPAALQTFLSNPKILKAGRNVTQDLKCLQNECNSSVPFVGAVELATLAKQKGVIKDAHAGLADICAAVLHARLDKTSPVRLSSNWDALQLTSEQIEYAALDAWASLEIYHKLKQESVAETVLDSAGPGTPVTILQDDGNTIARGVLSLDTSKSACMGINHTTSRARVTIQEILVPGAILRLHNISLASLGPAPFDIIVKKNMLWSHPVSSATSISHENARQTPFPSGSENQPAIQQLLEFFSQPISPDSNWTENVDDSDTNNNLDDDIDNAEADRLSLEEGLTLLREIEKNPSAWPATIHSRVLMDIWHAMARIRVSKEHGFRRPFARALHDAMLIPDQTDKSRISDYLISIGSSWEHVLQSKPKWLWKRCKRVVPPPEELYPAVKEVYTVYGPLLDSATKKPLFNTHAWKDASNVLKAIKAGLLSDPPGIALYYQIGVDKNHGNLPLYWCARGTNSAEGGVHNSGRRHLPISGVSARHASARLHDFVLMHNLVVSDNLLVQPFV